MKPIFTTVLLSTLLGLSACVSSAPTSAQQQAAPIAYTTGGFASVEIKQPVATSFGILANVALWPQINQGVTKAISPANIKVKVGNTFKESIASPVPGVKDWTNEWTIEEYQANHKLVIAGIDNFSSVPIHSRITYEFSPKDAHTTLFKRRIEVSLDEHFLAHAQKSEIEALYRFLGSQSEMATHLKKYVEAHGNP